MLRRLDTAKSLKVGKGLFPGMLMREEMVPRESMEQMLGEALWMVLVGMPLREEMELRESMERMLGEALRTVLVVLELNVTQVVTVEVGG